MPGTSRGSSRRARIRHLLAALVAWARHDRAAWSTAFHLVVVTGLAASGKTTVAVPLAEALGVPLISEEAIKEALFEAVGIGDWQWSKTLSRAADAALVEIAATLEAAVLQG